ncbi:FAD-dependent monooxygenase [Catenuloplanes japonicus]|uniref:FAD-dependent monooxygenase n=1 Tax=Catenuloplanes japonicus TaxID=33876 RepID=UPI000524FEB2|nr:FAD-dependent monooxygenase [Catenuloplanes japonicus]
MTNVIIAGGGVAGAATALALHKAGIPAAVYEAHASGGEDAGAFLTVMANGMAALDTIGATEAVLEVSYPARTVALYDAQGVALGERPIAGPARTMRRAALYRALQELAVARGIPVHHGKRLTGAFTFEDGTRADGDVLVGADGIHSRTRRLIDPSAPEPRYTGQHVIYGYADGNVAGVTDDGYHMIRGERAAFGFTAPGDGHTWWFARIAGEPGTGANWRELALAAVRDDTTQAAAIVTATAPEQVVGGDSYDIPTTPRWHDGTMVLTGDAAHAASPATAQGASMALADAVALAEALSAHPDDVQTAFTTYETRRRAETEENVAASAALNRRP